jgi:hypothetical protein
VIYPKELADAAGDNDIKEIVAPGRTLRRAQARSPREAGPVQGIRGAQRRARRFGGKRTAYLDEILFVPVPDVAVRLAGVETGE